MTDASHQALPSPFGENQGPTAATSPPVARPATSPGLLGALVRVAVVDDHRVVRQGIEALLRTCPDMDFIGDASNGEEALDLVARTRPDVLISDLSMPGGTSAGFLKRLRDGFPDTRVVILTMHATQLTMQEAFEAGACAFVAKDDAFDALIAIIRRVCLGEKFICSRTLEEMVERGQKTPQLTLREREILQAVTRGCSTKEISAQLLLSHKTVEAYRTNLMRKFRVTKMTELIHLAIASGIVPMTPAKQHSQLNAPPNSPV